MFDISSIFLMVADSFTGIYEHPSPFNLSFILFRVYEPIYNAGSEVTNEIALLPLIPSFSFSKVFIDFLTIRKYRKKDINKILSEHVEKLLVFE
jgi:hypothetical protein